MQVRRILDRRAAREGSVSAADPATATDARSPTLPGAHAPSPRVVAARRPAELRARLQLFNRLTELGQKVANFPGVTVEQHTGIGATARRPHGSRLSTWPEEYRFNPRSEDEQVALRCTAWQAGGAMPSPKLCCWCWIPPTCARHLMLAAPILALGLPTLVILNMADDLRSRQGQTRSAQTLPRTWRSGHIGQRARR